MFGLMVIGIGVAVVMLIVMVIGHVREVIVPGQAERGCIPAEAIIGNADIGDNQKIKGCLIQPLFFQFKNQTVC
jgi:hypothetical protein